MRRTLCIDLGRDTAEVYNGRRQLETAERLRGADRQSEERLMRMAHDVCQGNACSLRLKLPDAGACNQPLEDGMACFVSAVLLAPSCLVSDRLWRAQRIGLILQLAPAKATGMVLLNCPRMADRDVMLGLSELAEGGRIKSCGMNEWEVCYDFCSWGSAPSQLRACLAEMLG